MLLTTTSAAVAEVALDHNRKLIFALLKRGGEAEFVGRVDARAKVLAIEPNLGCLAHLTKIKDGIALLGAEGGLIFHLAAEAGHSVGGGKIHKLGFFRIQVEIAFLLVANQNIKGERQRLAFGLMAEDGCSFGNVTTKYDDKHIALFIFCAI